MTPKVWLAGLRHDLVKRMVWPARDRRDAGGAPAPGELIAELIDDDGRPITAHALWTQRAASAPEGANVSAFTDAVIRAAEAAQAGDVQGVIALEAAFDQLARSLEGKS